MIGIADTEIGFKYSYSARGKDLERTKRLEIDSNGYLKENPVDGIVKREFHIDPVLDIYLSNTGMQKYFERPIGIPTLGRSQDLSWISIVELIDVDIVNEGIIFPTLIPYPCESVGGRVIRLCDYFKYDSVGRLRKATKMNLYQIIPKAEEGVQIRLDGLCRLSSDTNEVVYLHSMGE